MKCRDFKVLTRTFTLLGLDTAIPSTIVVIVVVIKVMVNRTKTIS